MIGMSVKNSYFRFSLVLLFLCSLNTTLASDVSVEDVLISEEVAESSSDANVSKTNSSSDMAVPDSNASEKAEQSQVTPQTATSDYVKQLMSDPQNPDSTNSHTSTVQLATTVAGLFVRLKSGLPSPGSYYHTWRSGAMECQYMECQDFICGI